MCQYFLDGMIDVNLPHVGLVLTSNSSLMHHPLQAQNGMMTVVWFRGKLQCLVLLVLDWIILGVMLMYKK